MLPAKGIDYLELTERTHHLQVRADRRIGYDALFGDTTDDGTGDEGQIPGQLSIDDVTNVEDITDGNGASA